GPRPVRGRVRASWTGRVRGRSGVVCATRSIRARSSRSRQAQPSPRTRPLTGRPAVPAPPVSPHFATASGFTALCNNSVRFHRTVEHGSRGPLAWVLAEGALGSAFTAALPRTGFTAEGADGVTVPRETGGP